MRGDRIGFASAFECYTSLAGAIYVAFVIAAELETIEVIELNDKFEPVLFLQQAADCRKHDLRGAEAAENKIPDPMAPAELTEARTLDFRVLPHQDSVPGSHPH